MVHVEVVIIGGGVIGNSIAYHVARQGRKVLVIERAAMVASEPTASWASAGGVRRQGRDPAEAPLASEAIARWSSLEAELDAAVHYRQGGNVLVAENDDEAQRLVAFVQKQHTMGFADVRLVDRKELREIMPGAGAHIPAGSYSPADGQADPALTTRAFANAAQRYGATYWTDTICRALVMNQSRVTGVRTSRDDVTAEQVVLAAGVWTDELAAAIGLQLPITTRVPQMVLSTPAPQGLLTPVIGVMGRALSLKQLPNGAFLLGGGWPGDATTNRRGYILRTASIEGNWSVACDILPIVRQQIIAQAWCGLEAQAIDGIPFIGATPNYEGLSVAVGFSGHGFALAPAVGRALADQLAGKATPELAGLSPARIAQWSEEQIEAFMQSKHDHYG
jgi:sarcosine oxidase subunit beta